MAISLHHIEDIEVLNESDEFTLPEKEPKICCKQCQYLLTYPSFAISPNGQHQHLQCNPAGITFVFSCFSKAMGCFINGVPSAEFCWFSHYEWQFALCQGCGEHLGWYFSSLEHENFIAIINNKMTFVED